MRSIAFSLDFRASDATQARPSACETGVEVGLGLRVEGLGYDSLVLEYTCPMSLLELRSLLHLMARFVFLEGGGEGLGLKGLGFRLQLLPRSRVVLFH